MKTLKKPVKKTKTKAKTKIKPKAKVAKPVARKTAKNPIKKTKAVAKKPVKRVAVKKSKPVVKKKPAAKKPLAKKPVRMPVKKLTVKAPPRKTTKVIKTPVKALVQKSSTQTKTAERKAKRALKAKPVAAAKFIKPVWSPLVEAVLSQLDAAKAEQIVAIDLSQKSTVADTMVVASGRSNRHVNAIADQVVEELKKQGVSNVRIEGVPQCDWVLVDGGNVVVHVFRPEVRSFYNLEKLWSALMPE